jgi:DNA (cytosine-5)-methyltransferase 1
MPPYRLQAKENKSMAKPKRKTIEPGNVGEKAEVVRERVKSTTEIWSFFTGAGGLDLGLESSGLKTTLAVEIDSDCCNTLTRNRPELDVWQTDITQLDADKIRRRRNHNGNVFLMVGGPPCQSFSSGGKRAALSDPRGNLIYTYLRLIDQVSPQYFILENVAQLVTAAVRHRPISERPGKVWNLSRFHESRTQGDDLAPPMESDELSGSAIRQVFTEMNGLGYTLNFAVLDAADYGAAQHRYRIVMVGAREGPPVAAPTATHGPLATSGEPWRTLRSAIYDLRNDPGSHSEYTPDMARYFKLVPPGGNWRHLPKELQKEALGLAAFAAGGGKTGFFRRLSWDAPSPTITGRSNRKASAICHPNFIRPLSVRESARLQGFPDHWAFFGSMSSQYMQVGNAVPVYLGAAVGEALTKHVANRPRRGIADTADVERLLAIATDRLRATARNKRGSNKRQGLLWAEEEPAAEAYK